MLYASPTGSDVATCAQPDPCSIVHAFAIADATHNTIKLAPGAYTANLTINNKAVTAYGFGANVSSLSGNTFTVNDHASLTLVGLSIVAAGGDTGVSCRSLNFVDFPALTLDQTTVDGGSNAVFGDECTMAISRSKLQVPTAVSVLAVTASTNVQATIDRTELDGGGVFAVNGATVHVTNSVVKNASSSDGAFSTGGGSIIVGFTTVINSPIVCGTGSAVCSGSAPDGVCIDNSVILNSIAGAPADTVSGTKCFAHFNIAFPQSTALTGTNNRNTNPMLVDPSNANYHLAPGSPAIDSADPSAVDAIDFDGTARPQGPHDDVGAFEYKP